MIYGKKICIRPFNTEDTAALLQFQFNNKEFFEKYAMERAADYYTSNKQIELINGWSKTWKEDSHYQFGIYQTEAKQLVGTISLFQVLRGSLQSAFIGYFIDLAHNGKGYATEAVKLAVDYAFNSLHLHRIEAGVMPHNIGSIKVLEKAGFHKEGIARKNVKIHGKWEDHQVLAIINPHD
ncbi:N-acetyltransferase [Niallia circulans]|uniref:N-acetyltransferase n=1 Tax=Niallia circulans TaxID=1397 RepID=A0A553SMD8_NIACI|nr:GNAT family protein [Niallia circulans]TRZ38137.1 N-acetyltransferase [Niallia circulans]